MVVYFKLFDFLVSTSGIGGILNSSDSGNRFASIGNKEVCRSGRSVVHESPEPHPVIFMRESSNVTRNTKLGERLAFNLKDTSIFTTRGGGCSSGSFITNLYPDDERTTRKASCFTNSHLREGKIGVQIDGERIIRNFSRRNGGSPVNHTIGNIIPSELLHDKVKKSITINFGARIFTAFATGDLNSNTAG